MKTSAIRIPTTLRQVATHVAPHVTTHVAPHVVWLEEGENRSPMVAESVVPPKEGKRECNVGGRPGN